MGEDDPWQTLYEQTMRAMYAHHAVRRKICGTAASIGRITDELLRLTHTAFYRPDQMYLVVCGNITMERILAAIDGPLSALLQRESAVLPIRLYTPEGRGVLRRRVSRRGRVAKPIFQIAWKDAPLPLDPAARVRRETVMDLLSEMLFSRAGSFYHELFEKGKITPSYSYGYSTLGGENGLAYHSITGESDDPTAVLAAYEEYLKQIRKTGLDREDFERCRRVMYAGFVAGFDFVDDMADAMCEAKGNGNGLFDALQVIEQLTFEEVQSAFDAAFDPKTTVLSTIVPIDTEENE